MASIRLTTSRTHRTDPEAAAEELVAGLGEAPRLVFLFASSDRDQVALNQAIRRRLPAYTRLVGATTECEIDREGMHVGSVVLAGLSGDFDVGLGLGKNLAAAPIEAGAAAMDRACADLGTPAAELDTSRCFGIVIDDGLQFKKEELIIGMLGDNPGLIILGGGACTPALGADGRPAFLHVDGEVAIDAVLVAVFRTDAAWAALRSHWYEPTGQTLRITRVDDTCRRALEIDGKPAAERYAELLGVTVDDLEFGKPRGFSSRPTGIRVGREIFMRSPWKPLPDGSILFTNLLVEGTELELMTMVDPVASTRRFFTEELPRRVRAPTATLLFHCGGRLWTARSLGIVDEMSNCLAAAPNPAGMVVSFEIFSGLAINTTLTVLAFGEST